MFFLSDPWALLSWNHYHIRHNSELKTIIWYKRVIFPPSLTAISIVHLTRSRRREGPQGHFDKISLSDIFHWKTQGQCLFLLDFLHWNVWITHKKATENTRGIGQSGHLMKRKGFENTIIHWIIHWIITLNQIEFQMQFQWNCQPGQVLFLNWRLIHAWNIFSSTCFQCLQRIILGARTLCWLNWLQKSDLSFS